MKIRHKILLTTLSTLILSGPVVLGLVSALVIKNPDTPVPDKKMKVKAIGTFLNQPYNKDTNPYIYIQENEEATNENVFRFMNIEIGSPLAIQSECYGWSVWGTKIETDNPTDSSYNKAIDTLPDIIITTAGDKIIENKISVIGTFSGNNITSLIIPSFINSIITESFLNSNLTGTLIIPQNVTFIGEKAFYGCSKLTGLDLTNAINLTSISGSAFSGCSELTGILTIPKNIKFISDSAFARCEKLTGLDLTNAINLEEIGISTTGSETNGPFAECIQLTGDLIVPSSVTTIIDRSFLQSKLLNVYFSTANPPVILGKNIFFSMDGINNTIKINVPKGAKNAWDSTPDILTKLGIANLSQIIEK